MYFILHFAFSKGDDGNAFHFINYVCFSLFSTTIANSLEDCIYELVINTYCFNKIGFFSRAFFPFSIRPSPTLFSLPPPRLFYFFSWRCIRFELYSIFHHWLTCLSTLPPYHGGFVEKVPNKKCHYCIALKPIYMTKHMMYV